MTAADHQLVLEGVTAYDDGEPRSTRKFTVVRVHIDLQGESLLEDLMNRHTRPYQLYRKNLNEFLASHEITPKKINWRQDLACSCGCSPGFAVELNVTDIYRLKNIYASKRVNPTNHRALTIHLDLMTKQAADETYGKVD